MVGPELDGPGADEGFRVRQPGGLGLGMAEDLLGLPQVAFRADLVQLRLDLQQHGNHDQRIAGDRQRAPIAEHLVGKGEEPGSGKVRRIGQRVMGQGGEDLLDDQVLPVPRTPQEEMAQLVGQQGPELGSGQLGTDGTVQDDVGLARHIGQRGVQPLGILGLVDGDGNVECELAGHIFRGGVGFRLRIPFHAVGRFQQLEADRFRLLVADLVGGIPVPNVGLFRLEVVAQGLVVRQRLQFQRAGVFYGFAHGTR